jgi:hypothetical protein
VIKIESENHPCDEKHDCFYAECAHAIHNFVHSADDLKNISGLQLVTSENSNCLVEMTELHSFIVFHFHQKLLNYQYINYQ